MSPKEAFTEGLFAALDAALLIRGQSGAFRLLGEAPAWFTGFCPECSLESPVFDPAEMSPYLESFVEEAGEFFIQPRKEPEIRRSGWWTGITGDNQVHYFQATAAAFPDRGFLIIRHESPESDLFAALSRYKEGLLDAESRARDAEKCEISLTEYKNLVIMDELTGLSNERGFHTLAGKQMEEARRNKVGQTLFYVGLEDLARINEKFGHTEGSMAILAVASILRKTFGEGDVLARLSGSEFAVLAITGGERSQEQLLGLLKKNLDAHNHASFKTYRLELSTGALPLRTDRPDDLRDLLKEARKAMEQDKKAPAKEV